MTETVIPKSAYAIEYEYLRRELARFGDFTDLLRRFGGDDEDVTQALRRAHARDMGPFILSPQALDALRLSQPAVHGRIVPVYRKFLEEKASLA